MSSLCTCFLFVEYPEAPLQLSLQLVSVQPLLLRLLWSLLCTSAKRHSLSGLTYNVYLNQTFLIKSVPVDQLGHNSNGTFFVDVEMQDFKSATLESSSSIEFPVSLSIQACSEQYTSPFSNTVAVKNDILRVIYPDVNISDDLQSTQSLTSISNGPSELTSTSEGSQSLMDEITQGMYHNILL